MLVLVILLVVTNVLAVTALGYVYLRPVDERGVDETAAAALDRTPPPAVVGGTRRLISVEILNPIELASARGRLLGLAGSVAPGLTRRMVYDQTAKELKRQLIAQQVIADVHVHSLAPVDATAARSAQGQRTLDAQPANFIDEIDPPVDLPGKDQPPV